ncbi:Chitin binding Peritrophin-A domain [Popillia japonica]|uniref:Chitin binding Peritrophin-A domain n=1 Tax=Popillia japonica TaxID=7064 RepID=A0AAW1MNW0_POPJA
MCDWFGTAHVLDCPDGLHWNALQTTCDLTPCEDNLMSTTTESSTTEASSTDTTFTSPTTVTSSVSSTSSTTSSNRVCSHVICPPYSEDPSIVTVFPHDTDCSKYCMCDSDRIPHVMNCPDGLYWNKERRICDFRSNVVCGPSQTKQGTTYLRFPFERCLWTFSNY